MALAIFLAFVSVTLALSFYLGAKTKSASGYFAAGGKIHWFVNGIAFAGDYLSAASFLGICGMIAFYGYDGFLYSIGFLGGWVVALFVIAEPLKRMGKYTFADALDAKYQSRGIKLAAAISTLVVSVFYLIPQMVGAGTLVKPLLGLPHWAGVCGVGAVVIVIVVTAGMVSTTWVQFIKGGLLVIFSFILVCMILFRGLTTNTDKLPKSSVSTAAGAIVTKDEAGLMELDSNPDAEKLLLETAKWKDRPYKLQPDSSAGSPGYRLVHVAPGSVSAVQLHVKQANGSIFLKSANDFDLVSNKDRQLNTVGTMIAPEGKEVSTGALDPFSYISKFAENKMLVWEKDPVSITTTDGTKITAFFAKEAEGSKLLVPGNHKMFKGIRSEKLTDKLNFISLMMALFAGTASLPHILIRYYTVKDQASARKSTVVGIASIGFFYVLTLFIGLGAMTSGALDVTNTDMAAPLLARSFSEWLFAVISAIAFTTVLGTVSGLILAAAGAVVHDIMSSYLQLEMSDNHKVRAAKITSVFVGAVAIVLGIIFAKMSVAFLVGWAFAVAASANLPSLVMLLFWKGTTKQGITAAVIAGMVTSLGWILLSGDTYADVYGLDPKTSIVPFSQPGIVTIPLGFVVLIVVSLMTRKTSVTAPSNL